MQSSPEDRIALGRRLQVSAPMLAASVAAFYKWLPDAASKCPGNVVEPVFEDGKLAAVQHPLGRFETHEEFARIGDALVVWIVFCKPASTLRERPLPIYAVRLHDDGAFFGQGAEAQAFERDVMSEAWLPRNILRLGYELAVAATEPSARIALVD